VNHHKKSNFHRHPSTQRHTHIIWYQKIKTKAHLHAANRSQRVASKVKVDLSPGKVVDNHNIVSLITQEKRSWPSAEAITSQNNNLLLPAAMSSSIRRFRVQGERVESNLLNIGGGKGKGSHSGQQGDNETNHSHFDELLTCTAKQQYKLH
jgi:hypothetical protein